MHKHIFTDNWKEIRTNNRKDKHGYYMSYQERECNDCRVKEIKAVALKAKPDYYDH